MGRIEKILMKRDGNTLQEAGNRVEECRELCNACIDSGNFEGIEETIMGCLGLEMDYAMDILV